MEEPLTEAGTFTKSELSTESSLRAVARSLAFIHFPAVSAEESCSSSNFEIFIAFLTDLIMYFLFAPPNASCGIADRRFP